MLKKIDKRILYELDNNARQSYASIAKPAGTSKQVIRYRVQRLVADGTVKKFLTIFDLSKLGLILHKVYVRLTKTRDEDEKDIIQFLTKHPNVAWLVKTEGIYDLSFALHTKDIIELNNILLELEDKYGKFFSDKTINRVITGEFFHRDHLVEGKTSEFRKPIVFQTIAEKYALDETDWTIMAGLARDARISPLAIAKKVSITADAVAKRIKRLEQAGVIKNYIIVLNDKKLEQVHYKVLMRIARFTSVLEGKFVEFCRQQKNIIFYNKEVGQWDLEIDLEVQNAEEFRNIMRTIKREFAEIIKDYSTLVIYEVVKFDFIPMKQF